MTQLASLALCVFGALPCAHEEKHAVSNSDLKSEFESRYAAWRQKIKEDFRFVSDGDLYTRCREFDRIVDLGAPVVPLLVEKITTSAAEKELVDIVLYRAVERITKKRFGSTTELLDWWKSRHVVANEFETAYTRWKNAKAKAPAALLLRSDEQVYDDAAKVIKTRVSRTELGRAYTAMRELGIDVLPLIIGKLKDRDFDLLPLFGELTDGNALTEIGTLQERAEFTVSWWEANKKDWLLPPVSAAKLKDDKR
jgi:hypothetical protein